MWDLARRLRSSPFACLVLVALAGCQQSEDHGAWREQLFTGTRDEADEAPTTAYEETIRVPDRLRGIAAPGPDGGVVRVACFTCHGMIQVELSSRAPTPLQPEVLGPHVGLLFDHGTLDCAHCHSAADPSSLHTADGRALPTTEALEVCAQCHGLQWRDFQHGAHGGMRGSWDLNAGPRERNHCVDCHDPHQPAFGSYRPLPPPRDRFAPVPPHRANGHHEDGHATEHEGPEHEAPEPGGEAAGHDEPAEDAR